MSDTSIYVFIILFIVIFIILFIENIKKRYIPFVTRKERMNYPVIKVLPSCFVRSLLRSFSIIIPLIIIYIFGYLGTFGKNATKNFKLTLKSDTLLYEPLELIFPYKDTLSTPKTISSSIS